VRKNEHKWEVFHVGNYSSLRGGGIESLCDWGALYFVPMIVNYLFIKRAEKTWDIEALLDLTHGVQ